MLLFWTYTIRISDKEKLSSFMFFMGSMSKAFLNYVKCWIYWRNISPEIKRKRSPVSPLRLNTFSYKCMPKYECKKWHTKSDKETGFEIAEFRAQTLHGHLEYLFFVCCWDNTLFLRLQCRSEVPAEIYTNYKADQKCCWNIY